MTMIVAELFILCELISIQEYPQYWRSKVVIWVLWLTNSVLVILFYPSGPRVQRPLLFVLYSSLPEPISPNSSLIIDHTASQRLVHRILRNFENIHQNHCVL